MNEFCGHAPIRSETSIFHAPSRAGRRQLVDAARKSIHSLVERHGLVRLARATSGGRGVTFAVEPSEEAAAGLQLAVPPPSSEEQPSTAAAPSEVLAAASDGVDVAAAPAPR